MAKTYAKCHRTMVEFSSEENISEVLYLKKDSLSVPITILPRFHSRGYGGKLIQHNMAEVPTEGYKIRMTFRKDGIEPSLYQIIHIKKIPDSVSFLDADPFRNDRCRCIVQTSDFQEFQRHLKFIEQLGFSMIGQDMYYIGFPDEDD